MSGLNIDHKTILIGIGNDGRGDDALGWLFADQFSNNSALEVTCCYQLQIEDAALISQYDSVIFVDASLQEIETGYSFQKCQAVASVHFSTHKIDPATILWLAREIYQAATLGYVLAIQGYEWGLHQGLSAAAAQNFEKALEYFRRAIFPGLDKHSEDQEVVFESGAKG